MIKKDRQHLKTFFFRATDSDTGPNLNHNKHNSSFAKENLSLFKLRDTTFLYRNLHENNIRSFNDITHLMIKDIFFTYVFMKDSKLI